MGKLDDTGPPCCCNAHVGWLLSEGLILQCRHVSCGRTSAGWLSVGQKWRRINSTIILTSTLVFESAHLAVIGGTIAVSSSVVGFGSGSQGRTVVVLVVVVRPFRRYTVSERPVEKFVPVHVFSFPRGLELISACHKNCSVRWVRA